MAAPLKKEIVFIKDLMDRFIGNDLFHEDEITQYRFKINNIKQDNFIGISVWAFYWACSGNSSKAIACFTNSLAYAGPSRDKALVNFIFYLKKSGQNREYLDLVRKEESLMLASKVFSLWKDLAFLYLFDWRLSDFNEFINSREQKESDEAKDKGEFLVISNLLNSAKIFNEITGITEEQVLIISNYMIDIADSHCLKNIYINYRSMQEVNSIFFYTETDSYEDIANANLAIAKKIARDPDIQDLDVSPMFMHAPRTNLISLDF